MGNKRSKPSNAQNDAIKKAKEEEKAAIKKEKERVIILYLTIISII